VLEDQGPMLKKARAQLPPEEFEKGRMHVIRQLLKEHIQRRLLAEALRETLDKDQMERLDQAINSMYEQQVERLKKQFKVNTEHEVDLELQKQNETTLAKLKYNFAVQAMAGAYREGKADPKVSFGRPELLQYYEEHATDYDYPTRVRWQQLSVSCEKHGGRDGALSRLEEAVNKLKAGEDFGVVAQEYSDGANAKKGGDFGWSQPESIADDKVRQALTDLEPGTISPVIESGSSFRLVLVNDRREAGRLPFDKVQGKIQKKLEDEARKEAEQKLLEKLYAEAIVETIFDEPKSEPKLEARPIRANVNKPSANAAGEQGLPLNRGKKSKNPY
jgi:parvulin-like peptidyl-prolyl isomerase